MSEKERDWLTLSYHVGRAKEKRREEDFGSTF